jgi:SNF2 family DNA or RNA helicase
MKTTPLKHQKENLELMNKEYQGLTWEMGLGKTWMGAYAIEQAKGITLVISPTNVLETWRREILTHSTLKDYEVCVVEGNKTKRLALLKGEYKVFIVNYEAVNTLSAQLLKMYFDTIILDEAHRIKNPKAACTKMILKLKSAKRYILTGTPILNTYMDIFTLAKFLDRGKLFGDNYYIFRNKYFVDVNYLRLKGNFPKWELKGEVIGEIQTKLASLFHRLEKKDVLKYLPDKVYKTLYCYLGKEQGQHYKKILKECITFFNDKAATAQTAVTKLLRLNQITSGHITTIDNDVYSFEDNPKLNLLIDTVKDILAENNTNKIIIWAVFRNDIERIYKEIKQITRASFIYGGITKEQRKVSEDLFQNDPATRVFIGNPQSAGEGITLTKANYAIYYSMDYSLKNRLQSEDRCHRKGSEIHNNIVYIDLVMKNTVDEDVLCKVDVKIDRAKKAMDKIKMLNK